MSRKETLRAMLTRHEPHKLPYGNVPVLDTLEEAPAPPSPTHVRAGPVGIMGRSLGQIANAAEQARALIAAGNVVVEIPTDKIDGSFIADRFEAESAAIAALVESIRENGQQVPILVRPFPDRPDRYQLAYGHRRVRALAALGKAVRAVVLPLTDEQLVVAQGQENSARTDLSYIERARFAVALEDKGFARNIIMSALSMEKTQLSRLIALGRSIPHDIAAAIGSARKAGRPRWVAFAERLQQVRSHQPLIDLFAADDFRDSDTDTRFVRAFEAIAPKKKAPRTRISTWKSEEGRKVATIERAAGRITVIVDDTDAPEFGEFLAAQLADVYYAFQKRKEAPDAPVSAS